MAGVKFFRGTTAEISGVPVIDGQVLFDTESRIINLDYYNERLTMGNAARYIYPTITPDMWSDNAAFVSCPDACNFNISLGVPNPTSQENIERVRNAALYISGIDEEGVTVACSEVPAAELFIAFELTTKID